MNITFHNSQNSPSLDAQNQIIDFLFEHLEQYGDSKEDIRKALQYALNDSDRAGGLIATAVDNNSLLGVSIVNNTGMQGYIPENILVYIAIHKDHRGKGIGRQLLLEVIHQTQGNIALHVEPENPARHLYHKLGFEDKYQEMRLIRKEAS